MRKIAIYADGIKPEKSHIDNLIGLYGVEGATANPSLAVNHCFKSNLTYEDYSKFLISHFYPYPVSVQVLASDLTEMEEQARKIASWGNNVYVKIPIINEYLESCQELIVKLLKEGLKINITAIFTEEQVYQLMFSGITKAHDCILSVFCGRIADTGLLPQKTVERIANLIDFNGRGNIKLLWAGVRSISDIHYAREHCDIITIPQAVLDKLPMNGKDLDEYCLETVQMFANDAKNFSI